MTLKSSRTYHGQVTVPLSSADVLKAVQDPEFMIFINPAVHSASIEDTANRVWKITDRLLLLGFIPMYTTYTARFTPVSSGMDVEVIAGAGTRSNNKWRVREVNANSSEVTEESAIETFSFFMPFVWKTMSKAHTELMQKLPQKIQERK